MKRRLRRLKFIVLDIAREHRPVFANAKPNSAGADASLESDRLILVSGK
jgi:hypothetical protein